MLTMIMMWGGHKPKRETITHALLAMILSIVMITGILPVNIYAKSKPAEIIADWTIDGKDHARYTPVTNGKTHTVKVTKVSEYNKTYGRYESVKLSKCKVTGTTSATKVGKYKFTVTYKDTGAKKSYTWEIKNAVGKSVSDGAKIVKAKVPVRSAVKMKSISLQQSNKNASTATVEVKWQTADALENGDYVQFQFNNGSKTYNYQTKITGNYLVATITSGKYSQNVARGKKDYTIKVRARTAIYQSAVKKWTYGPYSGWKNVKISKKKPVTIKK